MARDEIDRRKVLAAGLGLLAAVRADPDWGWLLLRLALSHNVMLAAFGPYARRDLRKGIKATRFSVPNELIALHDGGLQSQPRRMRRYRIRQVTRRRASDRIETKLLRRRQRNCTEEPRLPDPGPAPFSKRAADDVRNRDPPPQ